MALSYVSLSSYPSPLPALGCAIERLSSALLPRCVALPACAARPLERIVLTTQPLCETAIPANLSSSRLVVWISMAISTSSKCPSLSIGQWMARFLLDHGGAPVYSRATEGRE